MPAHYQAKNKSHILDGNIVEGEMSIVANTLFKRGKDIIAAVSNVQLSANTFARRVSVISTYWNEQLHHDLSLCKRFSVHLSTSLENSSVVQPIIFFWMVFIDFTIREEFLTLLSLKTTTNPQCQDTVFHKKQNVPYPRFFTILPLLHLSANNMYQSHSFWLCLDPSHEDC